MDEVDNVLEDFSWLRDPNEELRDVEIEDDIDNERKEGLCEGNVEVDMEEEICTSKRKRKEVQE